MQNVTSLDWRIERLKLRLKGCGLKFLENGCDGYLFCEYILCDM